MFYSWRISWKQSGNVWRFGTNVLRMNWLDFTGQKSRFIVTVPSCLSHSCEHDNSCINTNSKYPQTWQSSTWSHDWTESECHCFAEAICSDTTVPAAPSSVCPLRVLSLYYVPLPRSSSVFCGDIALMSSCYTSIWAQMLMSLCLCICMCLLHVWTCGYVVKDESELSAEAIVAAPPIALLTCYPLFLLSIWSRTSHLWKQHTINDWIWLSQFWKVLICPVFRWVSLFKIHPTLLKTNDSFFFPSHPASG